MPQAGPPLATNTRELDHLTYVEKLRHWMRVDAWNPDGNRLNMKNPEITRSSVHMIGGDITRMPLLIRRPCFGIPTAFLPYRNRQRYVKGRGMVPTGRCHECKAHEACRYVVSRRLNEVPSIRDAWTLWLQHDGPNSFDHAEFKGSYVERLWHALVRELSKHPFSSSNDERVKLEYARIDADELEADRARKERERLAARAQGVVDELDTHALEQAMQARRTRIALALIHPDTPRALAQVPPQSVDDVLDVWLGRETLRLRRQKPNAPNIARWIVETGRSNRSRNHAALATRVDKDLKRIAIFERIKWDDDTLMPSLDVARELPSKLPRDLG